MPTMLDASTRDGILARLDLLRPDAPAQWGTMNATQMLAHVGDALRMTLGELAVRPKNVPVMRLLPIKKLMLYVLPFPKNAPTAKELRSRAPQSFDRELDDVKQLVRRLDPQQGGGRAAAHPLFGAMTATDWGRLGFKHLDHHLRQFGV
jgi:hypothetical protein